MKIQKCAVIGCGFVGATTAFTLMNSGLFSEMVLIDANQRKAEGEAMDLNHGLPFAHPMKIYAGDYSDLSDCALVIITAGTSQKQGQTRIDLVDENVQILKQIVSNIVKYNTDCILLLLSNPVDILTYAALKLSGFPANRVIGSGTVLDTARFKYLLGEHLKVDIRNIHAFIIGEHGDSELAVWSSANVSGIDLEDFCSLCGHCNGMESMRGIYEEVRDSGYAIVNRKNATYYGIAMATLRIVQAIIRDEHSVLPVSSYVDGHYGIDDVCMGLPSIVGRNGIERMLDIPLSPEEQKNLMHSAKTLKEVIRGIHL
jgi:L-lactate dehydrogenase